MSGTFGFAAAKVLLAVAQALMPAPDSKISDWVDHGHVILGEATNSPRPGPFRFDGVEYLREPLDDCHPDEPCSRITVRGGAQSAKSSIGQLWVAWSIANNPKSFAIGLPTGGEVGKYNDYKLQPIILDSPELRHRVRPVSNKSSEGSSVRKKRLFNGASILLFNLGSAAELQMISTGNLILEEVAGALKEVGSRGSPIKQARERQAAYSVVGSKELMVSTGGVKGECEVTRAYLEGDQRLYYGRCPQPECATYFPMEPEEFRAIDPVDGPHFVCPGCGVPLKDADRAAWRVAGVWLPTFVSEDQANPAPPRKLLAADLDRWRARPTEGRERSYQVWQAMCGLISLDKVAKSVADAKTPEDFMALEQQVYGRDYDPAIEAMGWEELHRIREDYDHGVVPEWAEVVTAFCDVQGSYLEWGAIAWGPGGEWRVLDRGVIEGDTNGLDVWLKLDEVTRRRYPHESGGELPIEAFGLDTGFRTQKAYAFARGRPTVFAMDGRPGWKLPFLGKPKPVKLIENGRVKGRVKLWPSGTWELKSSLYWSLKVSVEAGHAVRLQGRGHWSLAEDEAWAQQITAEALAEEVNARTGETERFWKKVRERNEWVDIWVGARALAWTLGVGAPARDGSGEAANWAERAAQRRAGSAVPQTDLFERKATSPAPKPAPANEKPGRFFRRNTRGSNGADS